MDMRSLIEKMDQLQSKQILNEGKEPDFAPSYRVGKTGEFGDKPHMKRGTPVAGKIGRYGKTSDELSDPDKDDDADTPAASGEKRGRGRPKKAGGQADTKGKYSGAAELQRWIVGSIPNSKLPGKKGRVHKSPQDKEEMQEAKMNRWFEKLQATLNEAEQVTMEPAKQDTQVLKQGDKVLGSVSNPALAATIKSAIGKGEMSLAGDNMLEDDMAEGRVDQLPTRGADYSKSESSHHHRREISVNGKEVDTDSLEIDGIDMRDYPDFVDAYFSDGEFMDGSEMSQDELYYLTDHHGELLYNKIQDRLHESSQNVAEGLEGQVVFSGTGANGVKYKVIHHGDDFMIHANGKHIDSYGSLQRAMSVLKNEVPGLTKGVAEGMDPDQRARLDDLIDTYRDATDPADDGYGINDHYDPDEVLDQIRREFGDRVADQIEAGTDKMHFGRHRMQRSDPLGWKKGNQNRVTKAGKLFKQDSDFMKNTIKSRYRLGGRSATESVAEGLDDMIGFMTQSEEYLAKQSPQLQQLIALRKDPKYQTPDAKKGLEARIKQQMDRISLDKGEVMGSDGKPVQVKESEKWIQKAIKHPGALKKQLGVPADEKIPAGKLEKATHAKGKLGQRARLAKTLRGMNEADIPPRDGMESPLSGSGRSPTTLESKSTRRDNRAERAGRKVTKDLEYDMYHHGKDDNKAERAGRKVTKDIEYDEKHHHYNEGKKQHFDKGYYDSIAASKKDGAKSIVKSRQQAIAEESTVTRDNRAEKAGRKVTKDIEYDEKVKDNIHGKKRGSEDNKAERAGRKVTKDIEYDEKKLPSMAHIKKMCKDGKTVAQICKMHPNCNQTELKKMITDCKKKMIKEGMDHMLHAARLEGKSHALRKMPYNCTHDDMEEARHYHEGYKEGLDECHDMVPIRGFVGEESNDIVDSMASYGARGLEEGLDPIQRARLDQLIDQFHAATEPGGAWDFDEMDDEEVIAQIRQEFGDKIADQVASGSHKMHYGRHRMQRPDQLGRKVPARITKGGKMFRQDIDTRKRDIKQRFGLEEDDLDEVSRGEYMKQKARTTPGDTFKAFGQTFHDSDVLDEFAFESLDKQLNELLNEGISVSISQGQHGAPNSVNVNATDAEADTLLDLVKQAGLGIFGGSDEQPAAKDSSDNYGKLDVADDHDAIISLIRKMTGGAHDHEEHEEEEHHHEGMCNECGSYMEEGHSCGQEMVGETETADQRLYQVAEDETEEQETAASEKAQSTEDAALAQAAGQNFADTDSNANASKDPVDESWANSTDDGFEADINFMTKVISGGLNKQKSTGQTTIPVIAGQNDRMGYSTNESVNDWKKLAGIR